MLIREAALRNVSPRRHGWDYFFFHHRVHPMLFMLGIGTMMLVPHLHYHLRPSISQWKSTGIDPFDAVFAIGIGAWCLYSLVAVAKGIPILFRVIRGTMQVSEDKIALGRDESLRIPLSASAPAYAYVSILFCRVRPRSIRIRISVEGADGSKRLALKRSYYHGTLNSERNYWPVWFLRADIQIYPEDAAILISPEPYASPVRECMFNLYVDHDPGILQFDEK